MAGARSLPAALVWPFRHITDLGLSGWFLFPTAFLLLAAAAADSPGAAEVLAQGACGYLGAARLYFHGIAVPGLFVAIVKRLIGRARPFVAGEDPWTSHAVGLAARLRELSVRPRHHGVRRGRRDRRAVAAAAPCDVDLCRRHRGQPGDRHRAPSERRHRRRDCRRDRRAAGAQLVRVATARLCGERPTAPCSSCRVRRGGASKRLPGGWSLLRTRNETTPTIKMGEATTHPAVSVVVPVRNEAGNVAPLVAEIAAALDGRWRYEVVYVNDGSSDGTEAELRSLMAQRPWLRSAAACAVLRAIGRFAQRRGGGARAADRHARRRRPERSGVPSQADRGAAVGRSARRADCGPAGRPQGDGLQEISVARRQRRARRDPARRHARHRLRPQGVSSAICFLRCLTSTGCTASCRRWSSARATRSATSTWSTGRGCHGVSNYGFWDRLWIGIMDLFGVWWLIRRRKRVPEVSEL